MTEHHPVVLEREISYEGYFDFTKLWRLIREFLESRNYDYFEKHHNEIVTADGKQIYVEFDIGRDISAYTLSRIVCRCTVKDLKDVVLEIDGKKQFLSEGSINFSFDGFVMSDYEGRYVGNGILFFIRTILEKFVYERTLKKLSFGTRRDVEDLMKEIRAYLNLVRY